MLKEKLNLEWTCKNVWHSVKRPLIISLMLFSALLFNWFVYFNDEGNQPLILVIFENSVLAIAIVLFVEFLYTIRILYYFKKYEDPKLELDSFDKHYPEIFKFYSLIGIIFYLILFLSLTFLSIYKFLSIYQKTTSFNNLANEEILVRLVKNKMEIKEDVSLRYYNGKYIFLEKKTKDSSEFIVLKGESLVDLLKDDK